MMKNILKTTFLLLVFSQTAAFAQSGKEKTPILVQSQQFTFYATSAMPQNNADIAKVMRDFPGSSGSNIVLDPNIYQLTIKSDSLIAYLPFYGRAYNPSMNTDERGIKFTSKDFTYKAEKSKKGNWVVSIRTNDNQRFTLNITANGYATLTAINVNRSSINFNGYIDATKSKSEKTGNGV